MGVVYKLQPKIKEYIFKIKEQKPLLSCRKISSLVEEKFKIKLSKSTVNTLIKTKGLSLPVGRRRKPRRTKMEAGGLGAIFLKAADYLTGGSYLINEAIKERLQLSPPELFSKTESLVFAPLFFDLSTKANLPADSALWSLVNYKFSYEDLSSYLIAIQDVKPLYLDILRLIPTALKEVCSVKVNLTDGTSFYLDGQLHTIWSTLHIPHDFSTTLYNLKSYINEYFKENQPFRLFMAPGYDVPTKEFFDFILSLDSGSPQISRLSLFGHKFEEIESVQVDGGGQRFFIFGLWPWQFVNYRRVISLGEFKPYYSEIVKKDFSLANIEIELSQPKVNKRVTLKGCALKSSPQEKIGLVILSNLGLERMTPGGLTDAYLRHWPNPHEAFQDFSRKVELFTYTASSRRFFSTEDIVLEPKAPQRITTLFNYYLQALDLYVRWHFFPAGFEEKDFSTMKEQFYSLSAKIKKEKDGFCLTFKPQPGYPFLNELEYACRRVNEREIMISPCVRLCCSVG